MTTLLIYYWATAVAAYDAVAASEGGDIPGISALGQYGPGGAVAVVITGVFLYVLREFRKLLDLERARSDRLEALVHEKYIPATAQMLAEGVKMAAVTAETNRVLQNWRDRDR